MIRGERPGRRWWLGVVVVLAGRGALAAAPAPLEVTFLAIEARGTPVLVRTPSGAAYLVDSGAVHADHDGGREIERHLRRRGVERLEGIVASHPHGDHWRGTRRLLERFPVGRVYDGGYCGENVDGAPAPEYGGGCPLYQQLIVEYAVARGVDHQVVRSGDRLDWDPALEVTVLAPREGYFTVAEMQAKMGPRFTRYVPANENSVVLLLRHGDVTFLLTGDALEVASDFMMETHGALVRDLSVVGIPHHGRYRYRRFRNWVSAAVAVASYEGSRPGVWDLIRRWRTESGSDVFATHRDGDVTVTSDGATFTVRTGQGLAQAYVASPAR